MYRTTFVSLVAQSAVVCNVGAVEYSIKRLGLSDPLHTVDDGGQDSILIDVASTGYSVGTSTTYKGHDEFGQSGWWSDGQNVVRVGLFDDEHRSDLWPDVGAYFSATLGVNANGVAVGRSQYHGGPGPARSAWMYDGQEVTRLGLIDADHTGMHGERETIVRKKVG